MHDDLVKRLRKCATEAGACKTCELDNNPSCTDVLMEQAADAIEFLHTYKVCFESMVQIGGWWLVGQDKALHRMNVPMNWPPEGTKTVEVFPLPQPPKEE